MLRHNLFACARDTSEGVRKPHSSTAAARQGPYPPLEPPEPLDESGPPRRPSNPAIGTVNTPVVVLSGRLKAAGSGASAWGGISTPGRASQRLDAHCEEDDGDDSWSSGDHGETTKEAS